MCKELPVQVSNVDVQDIETGKRFFVHQLDGPPSIERNLLLSLILVSASLDPLFFYIPVVNNDSNCLRLDKNLRIIIVVFLTFVDGAYIVLWRRHELASLYKKQYQRILSWTAAVLAILPLPQVVVYAVSWRLLTLKLIKFIVLIQFVLRAYLIVPTYRYARERFHKSLIMWLAAAFYLLLFILASNVLGAFWYLLAIERNMDCWRKACKARGQCGVSSLYCDGINSSNNRYLDEFCSIPASSNSTFFDHGIYLDAFQRDIIGTQTRFLDKFFRCLWWGLQSLSSLGQNLEPGTYIWDNLFSIFIVIVGLVLLALLIGNMQLYLQKNTASDVDFYTSGKRKRMLMKGMNKILESWRPFLSLPPNLRTEVMKCEDQKWLQTTEINLETLLHNAPPDLRWDIKLQFCENLFSNVETFKKLPSEIKRDLRRWAKAVVFQARSTIYEEGYPIYEMIHIVEGKALAFNKDRNITEGPRLPTHSLSRNDNIGSELLDVFFEGQNFRLAKEGKALAFNKARNITEGPRLPTHSLSRNDNSGSELLDLFLEGQNFPVAKETVQALTKVEAFVLSFDDIVAVLDRYGYLIPSYKKIWATKVMVRAAKKWARARAHADIKNKKTSAYEAFWKEKFTRRGKKAT